jgi:hypothetical protein
MGIKILNSLQGLTHILIIAFLIFSISQCFITFAVSPEKYENAEYSQDQVNLIALNERAKGIDFAYSVKMQNFSYSFIPLFVLQILSIAIGYASMRISKKT